MSLVRLSLEGVHYRRGEAHALQGIDWRVVAQGTRDETMTEEDLSRAYATPLRLAREGGRVWIIPRATPLRAEL